MKIAFDIMGFDKEPIEAVLAAKDYSKNNPEDEIILVGDKSIIEPNINKSYFPKISWIHTTDVIKVEDGPMAVGRKPNSSMVLALNQVKEKKADAIVTAGSSSAIVAGAALILKVLPNIKRPAFMPLLPTKIKGQPFIILDVGANLEVSSHDIESFAIMGSTFYKCVYKEAKPKVALLNIGAEENKGTELEKQSFKLLKLNKTINFTGNIEARYVMSGSAHVIVCDGYSGNICVKAMEGTASLMKTKIVDEFKRNIFRKISYLFASKTMKAVSKSLNYHEYGGAVVIGINDIVVKTHGSSNRVNLLAGLNQAKLVYDSKFIEKVKQEVKHD